MAGRRGVLILLCTAQFMVVLDAAIVNVALSDIQRNLVLSQQNLQWVVNAYTLAFGSFLLLGGRAADLLGRWRVFVMGLVLFSLASLVGGLAPSGGVLIIARGVQGFGAALVSPAALSILTTIFTEGSERNRALGIWGATAASGAASGVLLGGLLTNYLGWQWVLFVKVPIGLAVAGLSFKLLRQSRNVCGAADASNLKNFDLAGAVTITAGLVLLVYAVVGAAEFGWGSLRTLSLLVLAFLLIVGFVLIELRSQSPLVKFSIFRLRSLTGANLVALLHGTGPLSTLFFISLYLQQVLGFSALETGLAFLPFALMAAITSIIASPLVNRFGLKAMVVTGMLLMAVGLLLFARVPINGTFLRDVLPGSLLVGVGITLAGVPMTIAAVKGVEAEDSGLASGLINTSQQIGAAIMLALLVTLSSSRTETVIAAHGNSPQLLSIALTEGFKFAFHIGAALLAAGALVALLLIRSARSSLPRRKTRARKN
ncbi:MFS transporter [Scytonema sp. HK-05]|nr:MFS transporter [Scytonema sp. HK-05]